MDKKGDASEGIMFIVIIFFLAVSFVIVAFVNSQLSNVITSTPLNDTTASSSIVSGLDNLTINGTNKAFVFLFGGMILAMMLSSFMVRVHPAWLFLYIIFLVIAVILTVPLANIYSEMIANETLNPIASQLTVINWVMQNSIKILIGAVALSLVILFSKPPEGGNQI
jgi:hypothetical protein